MARSSSDPDVHELIEITARALSDWQHEADWPEHVGKARVILAEIAAYMAKHNIGPGLLASIAKDD